MIILKKIPFIIIILFASVLKVHGQPLVSAPGTKVHNQVYIGLGLEPELVTTIGYLHLISRAEGNLDFYIGTSLKVAPMILSNDAFRINLTGALDWAMTQTWKTRSTLDFYLAHDNNKAAVMNGLGIDLSSSTLHFGRQWAKGFEFGWQYTGLTHIKHSAETKDTFNERYPSGEIGINAPKDGWYRSTASRFRVGFIGSRKFCERWRVQLGLGALLSVQKQGILLSFSHAQVPFYLNSTVSFTY